jgi:hypothetical protein
LSKRSIVALIMKIASLIFLLLCGGCNLLDPPTHITEDLEPFVELVEYEMRIRGHSNVSIKVVFGDVGRNAAGMYKPFPPWDRKIMINREWFDAEISQGDRDEIIKTIAHEFGHSIGRDHDQRKREECSPESLMCKGCCVLDLQEDWEYYFDELFL